MKGYLEFPKSWHYDDQEIMQTRRSCQLPRALEFVLFACLGSVIFLIQVDHEYINGTPIPAIVFNGQPSTFHAFMICLVLAFACAFSALVMIPTKPAVGRITGCLSLVPMTSAVALLLRALHSSSKTKLLVQ